MPIGINYVRSLSLTPMVQLIDIMMTIKILNKWLGQSRITLLLLSVVPFTNYLRCHVPITFVHSDVFSVCVQKDCVNFSQHFFGDLILRFFLSLAKKKS